jgi:hypothetical protein
MRNNIQAKIFNTISPFSRPEFVYGRIFNVANIIANDIPKIRYAEMMNLANFYYLLKLSTIFLCVNMISCCSS